MTEKVSHSCSIVSHSCSIVSHSCSFFLCIPHYKGHTETQIEYLIEFLIENSIKGRQEKNSEEFFLSAFQKKEVILKGKSSKAGRVEKGQNEIQALSAILEGLDGTKYPKANRMQQRGN